MRKKEKKSYVTGLPWIKTPVTLSLPSPMSLYNNRTECIVHSIEKSKLERKEVTGEKRDKKGKKGQRRKKRGRDRGLVSSVYPTWYKNHHALLAMCRT